MGGPACAIVATAVTSRTNPPPVIRFTISFIALSPE
jgi:hypothetical protein